MLTSVFTRLNRASVIWILSFLLCSLLLPGARAGTQGWSVVSLLQEPGQVTGPEDVAVGGDGSLYVSETGIDRIQKRDPNGNWSVLATPGTDLGRVLLPVAVAVDSAGVVYVADYENNRIQRYVAPLIQFQPGDVNRDGTRDVDDAVLILRIIVNAYQPDAEQRTLSDVNGDAGTDVSDAVALLRIIVGL